MDQARQGLKAKYPFSYDEEFDGILQQHAIRTLSNMTADMDTYVTVGVGQHQMWAAQFFKFNRPRTWHSSSGLGTMGFGLPSAMGVQAAHPGALVIDIDGDGSFQMNIQELATCYCEELPVKVLLLNNQHLGMVVQWEDRFMGRNRLIPIWDRSITTKPVDEAKRIDLPMPSSGILISSRSPRDMAAVQLPFAVKLIWKPRIAR